VEKQINIDCIVCKEWEKPTLVKLSVSLTKEEDCTAKIGPGSPDSNTTCTYAGIATS
jgi:hypothetical protein